MPLKHTVEEVQLKNGAKGLLIHVPGTTSVRYEVQFRAGNNYAKDKRISQVAHILEHMSFGPNEKFDSLEAFSQEFSKNGAYSNAWTGSTDMVYTADAALMEWDRILDLQELAITKPKYPQAILDTEKGNVREEIIGYANDHGRILWQRIMREAGLERWYDPEELETIDAVTLRDIKDHYKRTHTLKNMRFVFAGDIKKHRKAIIKRLEGWKLPDGKQLPLGMEKYQSTGLVHVKRSELPNLSFNIYFFLNRPLTRRELRAMNVLTHILTDTMHSRIWGTARSRGICYGMGSWCGTGPNGISEFGLGGQVSFDNAKELFELIIKQLKIVSTEGISKAELDQAKEYRLGAMQMGTETVRALAGWYSDMYYDYDTIDYVNSMPALIKGTTEEEIKSLAHEFLTSGVWSFGGIGNIGKAELKKHYDLFAKALKEG